MRELRNRVREKLDGQEIRQRCREAARRQANYVKLIHSARRKGSMENPEAATDWLLHAGVPFTTETYYGVTLLYAMGTTLAFRPDGVLDWTSAPRIKDDLTQIELIDDSTGVIFVSPDSSFA